VLTAKVVDVDHKMFKSFSVGRRLSEEWTTISL